MSRRWVRVPIYENLLHLAFAGRRDAAITSDWPDDAEIVGAQWNTDKAMLTLTIQSATFDEVPQGNVIPDWGPTFTAHAIEPSAQAVMNLIDKMNEEMQRERDVS